MYNLEGGVIWTQELKNAFKTGTTYCSVIHNQQEYNGLLFKEGTFID